MTDRHYDPVDGRDPAGGPASWQIHVAGPAPFPGSVLVAERVKTHDGPELVRRSLPPVKHPTDRARAETLLDNEIRALTRLHARYRAPVPELPSIVGYDFDSAAPFVLIEPPKGRFLDGSRTLLIDERRRFLIGLFRALAQLAAVDLVHGSVELSSLCWDVGTAQLVNLEQAVRAGEPSRDGTPAHPGDDVRAAGRVVHELFTGKRIGPKDTPNLSGEPEELATLLRDVFAPNPGDRPTAVEMLARLNDREPLPSPVNVRSALQRGYDRFDALRPPHAKPAAAQPLLPSPTPRRPLLRRLFPLAVGFAIVAAATLVTLLVM